MKLIGQKFGIGIYHTTKVRYSSRYPINPIYLYLTLISFFGALLRFYNLSKPKFLIFDEVYYVKNAKAMLTHGVEFSEGKAEYVAHPPFGKWIIGLGIKVWGDNPFGWRVMVALLGVFSIFLVGLLAKTLFDNIYLTLGSAFLMSIDGIAIVQSKVSILEGPLSTLVLLAAYFFVRYYQKQKVIYILAFSFVSGLALSVKWSALYYFLALWLLLLSSTVLKAVGKKKIKILLKEVSLAIVSGILLVSTYLTTWMGWFISENGWGRFRNGSSGWFGALNNLYYYHYQMLEFHTNLTTKHNYQAHPLGWLVMWRPTAFAFENSGKCGKGKCSLEILDIGNPLIWWPAVLAILLLLIYVLINYRGKIEKELILLTLIGAGYLPWFIFSQRTTFLFYSGIFAPYLYIILAYVLLKFYNLSASKWRFSFFLFYLGLLLISLAYFYPLYAYMPISYSYWLNHMWFSGWI